MASEDSTKEKGCNDDDQGHEPTRAGLIDHWVPVPKFWN